jgi:transposase InsO family protein
MSAKEALIWDVNDGMSVTAAAEAHGVDRSCAYKWVGRYRELGAAGLQELSRTPEYSPNRTPQALVDELLELKRKHPDFGPAKLAPMLKERHGQHVMAVSTAGDVLSRYGLVRKRRSRQRSPGPIEHGPFVVAGAGDSMTTDYKGQFRMGNGALCYPLTIADPFSRYVFAIDALASTNMAGAKAGFERVFRKYGIPRQMISDNGTPFCSSHSLGGLTQLSRWWIELGIMPIRIEPGHPEQNGIHERMHRTLKDWIRRNRQSSLRPQQRSFNAFRQEFNHVRPHQSLGQKPPASALQSYRPFSSRPSKLEYDTTMVVRSVRSNGQIKWNGTQIFASEVLAGTQVGLLQIGEAAWSIHFGHVLIGYLDGLTERVQNRLPQRLDPTPTSDIDLEQTAAADVDDL